MSERKRLVDAIRGPGGDADFEAIKHAGLVELTPLTLQAAEWTAAHISTDAATVGNAVIIDLRYFPPIADAIIQAGFTFAREAWPQ